MTTIPANQRAKKLAIHIGDKAPATVMDMLKRQNMNGMAASQRNLPGGCIGSLGGSPLPQNGNLCLFTGIPINGTKTNEIVDSESAARVLPSWDGAFAGIFWDAQQQILTVVTDCLGLQPLYIRTGPNELTLVSETKALRGKPNLAAWGAFIGIGHPIGNQSLMSGLERVPPATIFTYDCRQHLSHVQSYWQWPEPTQAWRNYDFLSALEHDAQAYTDVSDQSTLLLSGGFDSRLLLFLLRRMRVSFDALIVAHEDEHGDCDGRLAQAVAQTTDIRWRITHPPQGFCSSQAYLDYLVASDVGYPSLDLFIAKVASQLDSDAVWDGLAPGFVFMPLHQPQGGFDTYLKQEVQSWDSAAWRATRALFKPEVAQAMFEGFTDNLHTEVSRQSQDEYGLARFVIENRSRNRPAMNPFKVYANQAHAFVPGLGKDFLAHAAMIPFDYKQQGRFYRQLFARLPKQSLAIPFLSGGEYMPGERFDSMYWRERAYIAYHNFRTRHPSLFLNVNPTAKKYSAFLGTHLLEPSDEQWLTEDIHEKLSTVSSDNYTIWKLLFHWKVWQWVHENRLATKLKPSATIK